MSSRAKRVQTENLRLNDPNSFGEAILLDGQAKYLLDADTRLAVRMAWATSRPLLVVGEAGCGKTHLAQALANGWEVPLLAHTVHARTEAQDLFFHFDAVARLSDAQLRSALGQQQAEEAKRWIEESCNPLKPSHYLRPGPLWWALNAPKAWALNADRPPQYALRTSSGLPTDWAGGTSVVLIDEVDKGSDELAESLLEVLDTGRFTVPWTGETIVRHETSRPFLLLTSNGARQLPAPFLRRCIVLAMQLPQDGLVDWLIRRGRAHFSVDQVKDDTLRRAGELISEDRIKAAAERRYKPGVAEYLYLCEAVSALAAEVQPEAQCKLIEDLAPSVTRHKGEANRVHG